MPEEGPLHELKHKILKSNITEPNISISILTQHVKKKKRKKIMNENKTILSFLSNQYGEKDNVETEKINKLLKYIPTDSITEENEPIYAG